MRHERPTPHRRAAAERWQVPKSHVYRLAREGQIPTVELGRYRRWRVDAIEQFEQAFNTTKETA